jgi:hypothetical protein
MIPKRFLMKDVGPNEETRKEAEKTVGTRKIEKLRGRGNIYISIEYSR